MSHKELPGHRGVINVEDLARELQKCGEKTNPLVYVRMVGEDGKPNGKIRGVFEVSEEQDESDDGGQLFYRAILELSDWEHDDPFFRRRTS